MSDMALFDLLPGFHRSRDAENGDPLRLLLGVLETELAALKANIALLYNSWFIDSCPDWAVPYIADLVGLDEAMTGTDSPGLRALVANTVGYQRRRGTLATLGHVASAITGWPALAEDLDARMVRSHGFGGTGASGSGMAAGTLALRGAGQQLTGQQLRGGPRGHPLANEPAGARSRACAVGRPGCGRPAARRRRTRPAWCCGSGGCKVTHCWASSQERSARAATRCIRWGSMPRCSPFATSFRSPAGRRPTRRCRSR